MTDTQNRQHDTALRHGIYNASTDSLRTELASVISKSAAILIALELQRRGDSYNWPFKQARRWAYNRA